MSIAIDSLSSPPAYSDFLSTGVDGLAAEMGMSPEDIAAMQAAKTTAQEVFLTSGRLATANKVLSTLSPESICLVSCPVPSMCVEPAELQDAIGCGIQDFEGDSGMSDYEDPSVEESSDDFGEIDYEELGIDPSQPTIARPGTEEKVLVLSARYAAGVPLWHPHDCIDDGSEEN